MAVAPALALVPSCAIADAAPCFRVAPSRTKRVSHSFCLRTPSSQGLNYRGGVFCCAVRPPSKLGHTVVGVMEFKIYEKLGAEQVVVKDAYGDGRYLSVDVVSAAFEGKSRMDRQKMVYKAVWEEVKHQEHIIEQIRMRSPAEAASSQSNP